jgi:hypothetical protein
MVSGWFAARQCGEIERGLAGNPSLVKGWIAKCVHPRFRIDALDA